MEKRETIKIEKVVQGGKGLARLDGRIVLIDRVLPGEEVSVVLYPRKGVLEGKFPKILAPSPVRVSPDCPFYNDCGGCDFRHTDYQTELKIKEDILRETFLRVGKISDFPQNPEVIPSPRRDRYRVKTRFQCQQGKKGFFRKGSHSIVQLDDCLLMPEHLTPILRKTRCRNSFFLESHPFRDLAYRYRKPGEPETIEIEFPGYTLLHQPGNFFQANRFLLERFIESVLKLAGEGETVCELFAGSGFLTLPLSRRFAAVSAMEWSHSAVQMLKKSLQFNEISNVVVTEGDCNHWNPVSCDVLVLDPPREGVDKELARRIGQSGIGRIVYVSCDAATLARDIHRLESYRIEKAILIDMFPGTAHFETMVLLSRGKNPDFP